MSHPTGHLGVGSVNVLYWDNYGQDLILRVRGGGAKAIEIPFYKKYFGSHINVSDRWSVKLQLVYLEHQNIKGIKSC